MNFLIYIFLGALQGISEPLPISSSGHLYLFKEVFNTKIFDSINFEIFANFGSFLAILFIFRKDITDLVNSFFKYLFDKDSRLDTLSKYMYCWYIVISSIPVVISGLFFKDYINFDVRFLSVFFLITALSLFVVNNILGKKDDKDITFVDAIIIGLFQSIAIIPGISRSGAVLVACLLRKLKRETALKYTFILYFPVSLGAMALGVGDFINSNEYALLLPYFVGSFVSLIVTYFSYKWLSSIVKNGKLIYFGYYCICLAIFILFYFR